MRIPQPIDDPAAVELIDYRDLRSPRRRRRIEVASPPGFFIAEGATVVERLLASPLHTRSVVVTPGRVARVSALVPAGVPYFVVPGDVLAAVVGFDMHRGIVASADRPVPSTMGGLAVTSRTLALFEGLNDHENLGAAWRSAAALGVDAIGLDPTSCDPWYRRSVRVSMGGVLTLPFARVDPWPAGLGELSEAGFTLLAFTPANDAQPLDEVVLPARIALLFGAEGPGLTDRAIAAADMAVRIPMVGDLDSLNVAHAAAIAFHVAARRTSI